jgi:hypothetical protein
MCIFAQRANNATVSEHALALDEDQDERGSKGENFDLSPDFDLAKLPRHEVLDDTTVFDQYDSLSHK